MITSFINNCNLLIPLIHKFASDHDWYCTFVNSEEKFIRKVIDYPPDVIFIDTMTTKIGKENLIKKLRKVIRKDCFIFFVSTDCTPENITLALNSGADYCLKLTAPPQEIFARIKSATRRLIKKQHVTYSAVF